MERGGRLSQIRALVGLLPRAARLAMASSPRGMAGLVALTLGAAALPPSIAWVGKLLVDSVVARDPDKALRLVAVELALVAALVVLARGTQLLRQTLGARLGHGVNVMILEKALHLDLADFEDPAFYDQLTRARREASSRPIGVVMQVFDITKGALTLSGYAALLFGYSPLVCLALAAASLPATIAEVVFGQAAFRLRNWRSPDTRRLFYMERVLASDDHAKEIKLLGVGPLLLERYQKLGDRITAEDAELAARRFRWGTALSVIATTVYYGAYASMVVAAARGKMTLGEMTLYAVAFRQGQESLQSILGSFGGMHEHALYLSNLYAYLDRPLRTGGEARFGGAEPARGAARLTLEDVSFRYPGAERWALRHVTLDVPPGRSLAIVGHNGAGKTTLIKLLLGLYVPTEGRVLLDGVDVTSIPAEERLRTFAAVFQDFARWQLTVRENIGFGDVEHLDDDPHLERAVERGGAKALVGRLSSGLETQLGKWFDAGVELSGGEWQSIALARSFAREGARVLILDEPTAALDANAEQAVFQRFHELAKGRTAIVISHRFPTVRMADQIVVVDGGELRESGTHAELIERGGVYAKLFDVQASGYR
ncbi:MAG: ABC transporter ATP-binding protein [Myxococcales bacterium]|nr:ABC transporter ATP-binding protein [Myxococcales bacterium]